MSLNLKYIFLLPLLFLFLPALYVPFGIMTPAYFIIILILSAILFCCKTKELIQFSYKLFIKTPFKYLCFFFIWVLTSIFILFIISKIAIAHALYAIFVYLLIYTFLYYIYPAFCCYKFISIKSLYKFLIVAWLVIFIWGIIAFIGVKYNINFINCIASFFSNRQALKGSDVVSTLVRARSTFFEPGFYAYFISLNLPLFYTFAQSKQKLLKNRIANRIIRKIIVPLAWINLILALSPIGILFGIIITIFYFTKKIKRIFFEYKKISILGLVVFIFLIFGFLMRDSLTQNSVFKRIYSTFINLYEIENLNQFEPSLYTRIVSYTNSFILFTHNSIIGTGFGESKYVIHKQFENSPLVLSKENSFILTQSYTSGKMVFNRNILCDILSETGIIGFILFYFYLIRSYLQIKKCTKHTFFIDREFSLAISKVLLAMICLSFYEVSIVNASYHFFIFAIANVCCLKMNKQRIYLCQKYQ